MQYRHILMINLLLALTVQARFPEEIRWGPGVRTSYSKNLSLVRVMGRVYIPGGNIDIEVDPVSLSLILDREDIKRLGISWVSLVGISAALISKRVAAIRGLARLFLGTHSILNANLSAGNSWVRAFAGWSNDFFISRDFLWIFEPAVGLKFSFPGKRFSDVFFQAGIAFPASFGEYSSLIERKKFQPGIFIGLNAFPGWAEIILGTK